MLKLMFYEKHAFSILDASAKGKTLFKSISALKMRYLLKVAWKLGSYTCLFSYMLRPKED